MFYDFITKYTDNLLKKMREASHIFSTKNIGIFEILMFEIFNVSLTNDIVSFERPGPGFWQIVHYLGLEN